ncbi:M23 family metallopeptidase [Streptomyces sp. NPDC059506]
MASNEPAQMWSTASLPEAGPGGWNPTEESVAAVRGKHRLPKQRTISRGSTVLGVAAVAAMGAGGVATAQSKASLPISVPDMSSVASAGLDTLVAGEDDTAAAPVAAPLATTASSDAGEALRTRILEQAAQQQNAADSAERAAAEEAAAEKAAKEAAEKKVREDAAKKAAEEEARKKAAEEAAKKAEAERLAKLAASFTKPTSNYTLTAGYGQAGSMWSADHTGQDFAAPSGTPVVAVHGGEITSAGWAGSYGYRIILTLPDGTEIWYCHLSSMTKTSGTVSTGETIGRVGSTGNSTGPHLHLEVRPGGGSPVAPVQWLRDHGVTV